VFLPEKRSMKKDQRVKYTLEDRQRLVELVRSGRSLRSVASEYRVAYASLRKWVLAAAATPS
jgi:transposase-like protein